MSDEKIRRQYNDICDYFMEEERKILEKRMTEAKNVLKYGYHIESHEDKGAH